MSRPTAVLNASSVDRQSLTSLTDAGLTALLNQNLKRALAEKARRRSAASGAAQADDGDLQDTRTLRFPTLLSAIDLYSRSRPQPFNFHHDLLPHILAWAQHPTSCSLPILKSQPNANAVQSLKFTAADARHVLANAFLLNHISPSTLGHDVGNIDLLRLFCTTTGDEIAIARVVFLIAYFDQARDLDVDRVISIERHSFGSTSTSSFLDAATYNPTSAPAFHPPADWSTSTTPIVAGNVRILEDRMEASPLRTFVDFANKRIHIHSIIPSATQEEVLFSCAPELFLSICLCETIAPTEIVYIRNARRFVDYTGYLDTFRYAGWWMGDDIGGAFDVAVLDATYRDHFTNKSVDVDMGKAFVGFACARDNGGVVTGHWGCGVFGGEKTHKFLQQVCAAAECGLKKLDYSVFHDAKLAAELGGVVKRLEEGRWTVGEVYEILLVGYQSQGLNGRAENTSFGDQLMSMIKKRPGVVAEVSYAAFVEQQLEAKLNRDGMKV
ncbi:hypothetical protein HK101_004288 [Irineochytrium annulatum]|nr:hypothetical protein HK101_004288 [Irineochytrium annulatum]